MLSSVPNMSPADTCFGIWSTVLAEYTFRVPSARSSTWAVEAERHAVRARVAEVDGHGVAAVRAEDWPEAPVDLGEGLVPRRRLEGAAPAHERDAAGRSGSASSSFRA